jgi:peptidyl-prolyl cis-trans isomerase SurA
MTFCNLMRASRTISAILAGFLLLGLPFVTAALAQSTIRILVNDIAITSYDISQRAKMLSVFSRNQQGEKEAIEQLIDERLMLQEALSRGVKLTDAEIDEEIAKRASAAKLSTAQFQQAMRQAGFDPQTFRDFVGSNMAWQEIVRARFRATVDITDQDVAAALTEQTETGEVQTVSEYMLQPIIFVVPAGAGAGAEAQQRDQANAFRSAFQGCDSSLQQAGGMPGIVVKPRVRREEGQMTPAMKEMLSSVGVGGITEPERVAEGIQLLAVCSKQAVAGETTATVETREELSSERGKLLARRYLRDLRSDAVIEYR